MERRRMRPPGSARAAKALAAPVAVSAKTAPSAEDAPSRPPKLFR
jgi:hypothetical protein